MSKFGKLISLFPVLNISLVFLAFVSFVGNPSFLGGLLLLGAIYAFPLVAYHIHQRICPVEEKLNPILEGYCPWYGTHMIQSMHIAFPFFERLLRLVPGLFDVWLRLWGSKVGKNVHWTPVAEIADRGFLDIGDNVVFGYNVKMSSHVVTPNSKLGLVVYVKRITFEDRSFVGAESRIAPGVLVKQGALVPAVTDVYPDEVIVKKEKKKVVDQTPEEQSAEVL